MLNITIYNNLDDIIFQAPFTYTPKTLEDIFYNIMQEIQTPLFVTLILEYQKRLILKWSKKFS